MVALLGPSGCGKTTTLRMIAGLVEPTEGDVLIGGFRVTRIPVHRRNIGMLFQNYALFPHMSVAENVAFGLQMRGLAKAEIRPKVEAALSLVRLGDYADRLPSALSGGQQQRVALARAIVIEPNLLLLDEPLGALDRNLRENMQVEIRQIQKRLGITAVLVTHDQEEALTMADRVVIMRGGKLEQVGTPEQIYSRPASRFVASFIGTSNFLRGNVAGYGGGMLRVSLAAGGQVLVPWPDDGRREVLISVRPEAVALAPLAEGAMPEIGVPATVQQVVYRGQTTHVHMQLADGEPFVAFLPNRVGESAGQSFAAGDKVSASWSPQSNWLVSDA
ncbi:MAG: ABC transporter ATP-binding protein [Proteobacteria bacterium]|nr:ABC transporter ATP-binding protein [Pseudomonadota bacterium]